jgi:RNA polymerase sigma-70 factor (ECF subfamily)
LGECILGRLQGKEVEPLGDVALEEMVRQHGNAVYRFCRKLAGNKADADDLYQETFLKALELRPKLDDTLNPKSYLIGIAVRLWKNKRRKWFRRQRIAPEKDWDDAVPERAVGPGHPSSPEEIAIHNELSAMIRVAVDQLQDKYRLPLLMFYTAELSIDEIAKALCIPQGTVKSRLHKARKLLEKRLEVREHGATKSMGAAVEASSYLNR